MKLHPDPMNLGQGIVHWQPPPEAIEAVVEAARKPSISCYGPNEGMPELREALRKKVSEVNHLPGWVTAIYKSVIDLII